MTTQAYDTTYFLPLLSTACMKKNRAGRTTFASSPGPHTKVFAALGNEPAQYPGGRIKSPSQHSTNHDSLDNILDIGFPETAFLCRFFVFSPILYRTVSILQISIPL